MRHAAIYYFLLIAAANAWLTWFLPPFTGMMARQWQMGLGGATLPPATNLVVAFAWWPAIFLVASLVGAAMGIVLRNSGKALLHAVIVLLLIEGFLMFWNGMAYALPYVQPLSPLK